MSKRPPLLHTDNGDSAVVSNTHSHSTAPQLSKSPATSSWKLRLFTLVALCFSDGTYTVLRRYSRGVRGDKFSFNEVLLLSEFIKMGIAIRMVHRDLKQVDNPLEATTLSSHLVKLLARSRKMLVLAVLYGIGNVLSYIALRRIGAGLFVVLAMGKTLTTAIFSAIMLSRSYSWTQWRALVLLVAGIVLFVLPTLKKASPIPTTPTSSFKDTVVGICAEIIVVTLSGFASIYFEKAIKQDSATIWERNFQLAFYSVPVYLVLILSYPNEEGTYLTHWNPLAFVLSIFGAMGGLLVALSILYGDSVLKTLAISGSIIYSSIVDRVFLGGVLTGQMAISALIVIIAIFNYTFDTTPKEETAIATVGKDLETKLSGSETDEEGGDMTLHEKEALLVGRSPRSTR